MIVARLHEKDKEVLASLKIWKKLNEKYKNDWKLVIVGDGPDRKKYQKFITDNKIKDIYFQGAHLDLKQFYIESSILLVTSPAEGFGLTLIEAQQFACVPIVYNSFSALNDIIVNDYNGKIIPNREEDIFVDTLYQLMNDKEKRNNMGINGLDYIKKFFRYQIVQKWIDLLDH